MFNERMALKLRLEQMQDAEQRLLAELQKERALILHRLRELDEQAIKNTTSIQALERMDKEHTYDEINMNLSNGTTTPRVRKGRPSRRSKTTKMRECAIDILKQQQSPIRGSELQKKIEVNTGFRIANMTTFMNTIKKTDDKIIKTGRGLYLYETAVSGLALEARQRKA